MRKLKMGSNAVLLNLAKLRLNNWPTEFFFLRWKLKKEQRFYFLRNHVRLDKYDLLIVSDLPLIHFPKQTVFSIGSKNAEQSHVTSIADSFDFRGFINWPGPGAHLPGPLAWELFGRKVALKLKGELCCNDDIQIMIYFQRLSILLTKIFFNSYPTPLSVRFSISWSTDSVSPSLPNFSWGEGGLYTGYISLGNWSKTNNTQGGVPRLSSALRFYPH